MNELTDLFGPAEKSSASNRRFTVLRKDGHPILYVPHDRRLADATLRLYPAQTRLARTLISVARGVAGIGLPISRETLELAFDEEDGFAQFLKGLIPGATTVPFFGVLAGNIKAAGRRHTLLLFDLDANPALVVKAGVSPEARELIRAEQAFFFPQKPPFPGMPEAVARYDSESTCAIAYRYIEGCSPTHEDRGEISILMGSWIYEDESVPMRQLPVWEKLEQLRQENPGLDPVFEILRDCPVHPVLFHGDFAPWNVRIGVHGTNRSWTVLDWERSQMKGIPAWDWLHYHLQYEVMVLRAPPQKVLSEIEALWKDPAFLAYARKTGIQDVLKELTLVFLLYFLRFYSPRDNAARLRLFLEEFRQRYFKDIVLTPRSLKISVVTPSYKQLPWLKLCAASVADQKDVQVEHIIQDAQSGPELEAWVRKNTSARLYVECDSGMYDAINRGFARATGDIVGWLNSDEQYLEGTLAKVARYFENHPEIDVLFGDALLVGNTGNLISYRRTIAPKVRHIQASHLNVLSCATFVRRSVLTRGHELQTRWKAIADAVWVAELIKAGIPMAVINEPLAVFTITDINLGQTSLARSEILRWQTETASEKLWLRPYFVLTHRLHKFLSGAYWPRSISVRLFTLASPNKRVTRESAHLGFRWPSVR